MIQGYLEVQMHHVDFSSWPREQEAAFAVYEQHNSQSQHKAMVVALAVGGALLLASLGVYFGVEPEHKDLTKGMNMSNLTKKSAATPTPDK
jgi:hypothetical protein